MSLDKDSVRAVSVFAEMAVHLNNLHKTYVTATSAL